MELIFYDYNELLNTLMHSLRC